MMESVLALEIDLGYGSGFKNETVLWRRLKLRDSEWFGGVRWNGGTWFFIGLQDVGE